MNKPPVQPEPALMLAGKPQIHCPARKSELQDHYVVWVYVCKIMRVYRDAQPGEGHGRGC